jgi:Interferon-induced 6-16 family
MIHPIVFPCLELPAKCFLQSSSHKQQRVGCLTNGSVVLTEKRGTSEEWYIVPFVDATNKDNDDRASSNTISCHIKSRDHNGLYLVSNADGFISANKYDALDMNNVWYLESATSNDEEDSWRQWYLTSKQHNRYLSCNNSDKITTCSKEESESAQAWIIEFLNGELCILQSKLNDKFMTCSPWGQLSMASDSAGWQVWRFIRLGDQDDSFVIASWSHSPKCLASSSDGNVHICNEHLPTNRDVRWVLEQTSDASGVIIRSWTHQKVLCCNEKGEMSTTDDATTGGSVWDIQAANKSIYRVSMNNNNNMFMTATKEGALVVSKKQLDSNQWEIIVHNTTGTVSLKTKDDRWLSVDEKKHEKIVLTIEPKGILSEWQFDYSPNGGVHLLSNMTNKYLSYNGTEFSLQKMFGEQETFALQPILPPMRRGDQILKVAGAGILAVGLVCAAPLVVTGAVGAIGFGSGGITAGSIAAGMMSAEAVAAGGGVAAGGLVATLQSVGAIGLGTAGTTAAMTSAAVVGGTIVGTTVAASGISNETIGPQQNHDELPLLNTMKTRPFCAWRSYFKTNQVLVVPSKL